MDEKKPYDWTSLRNSWKKVFTNAKAFFFSFVWLIVLIFVVDIVTKWVVQTNVVEGSYIEVIPNFISITLHHNLGAAFGLGSDGNIAWRIVWLLVSLLLSAGLSAYYIFKSKDMETWVKVGFALMIAGAVGNLIDRAFYWEGLVGFDGVIDWISISFFPPIFNVADASLVIGCFVFIIVLIIDLIKEAVEKNKKDEYSLAPMELEAKKKKEAEEAAKKEAEKEAPKTDEKDSH